MAKSLPKEDLGKPIQYDPKFDGPLKNRSCTDVICLLLFLVFIGCWLAVGFWAIKNGDPHTLLVPRDSQGLRCGLDSPVENQPYLFFFDLTKCISASTPFLGCDTTQVCVAECPSEVFIQGNGADDNKAVPFCKYEQRNSNYNEKNCPAWYLPSDSFEKRCIPSPSVLANKTLIEDISKKFGFSNFFTTLTTAVGNIKLLSQAEQVAEQVIADIVSSWWKILIGIGMALLACLIYVLMLRWIAGIMVWFTIAGVVAGLTAATYFSCVTWRKWVKEFATTSESAAKTKRDVFLGIFIVVVILLAIVLLVLLFLRNRIRLAIALIKEGSKAVSSVTSVLFFPLFPWLFQVALVAYSLVSIAFLATTGDPLYKIRNITQECAQSSSWTDNTTCDPKIFAQNQTEFCATAICKFVEIQNEKYYPYFMCILIFGFFWVAFFISALGQMVLAQVFAQWYWTAKKSTLPFFALTAAFYRTIRYHLGTLTFGSLIIAICRVIRLFLEYIDRKLKKYDNEFTKAIMCCLKCFFWCLEKFLKFINKNAYIMCAIHGKNFCASAKDAFMLLMRNIIRVFVLDKVTDFLFFLSKVLVTVGVGAVAYLFFATDIVPFMDNSQLNYGEVPVAIIMIVTYLLCTLFFHVYGMAVDTLFLCFLEDCERNDGKTRPYFMSRNLMKIFGKKNKIQKLQ